MCGDATEVVVRLKNSFLIGFAANFAQTNCASLALLTFVFANFAIFQLVLVGFSTKRKDGRTQKAKSKIFIRNRFVLLFLFLIYRLFSIQMDTQKAITVVYVAELMLSFI